MPSPYHWVTGGQDHLGALPLSTNFTTALVLPAGSVLKKFLLRNTWVGGFLSGLDHTAVQPMYQSMAVAFVGGVHDGRTIYSSDRDIPFEANSFLATAVDVYTAWWHAADEQLGFKQQCSYDVGGAGPADLEFTTALNPLAPPFGDIQGDWHWEFAALYKL